MKIVSILLPVILSILLGYIFYNKGFVKKEGIAAIKMVVVKITLPMVVLKAFMTNSYSVINVYVFLLIFVGCVLSFFLGKILKKQPIAPFLTSGYEVGMLGYALIGLLLTVGATQAMAVIDLGQVLFVFTFYSMLALKKNGQSMKEAFSSMAKNPILYATVIGVVLGATGLYSLIPSELQTVMLSVTSFIEAPTAFLVLFAVGSELDFSKEVMAESIKLSLYRLVVMGLIGVLTYLAISNITDNKMIHYATIILFILPPPFVLPMLLKEEKEVKLASTTISISTILTLLLFAVFAAIIV